MLSSEEIFYWTVVAGFFIWLTTIIGSMLVLFVTVQDEKNTKILDATLGAAAGFMVAASVWSLLIPAVEKAKCYGNLGWMPVSVGFFLGCAFVFIVDLLIPMPSVAELDEIVISSPSETASPIPSRTPLPAPIPLPLSTPSPSQISRARRWKRIMMMIIAITIHNMPEAMAVGVAFGAIGSSPSATFANAISVTIGIGIQNMPEGLVISLPLVSTGWSKWKSFVYGCLTGVVEPFFTVFGYLVVVWVTPILPYVLSFAAGAMIHVTAHDVIPEANMNGNGNWATWGFNLGFILLMALEVYLD